MLQTKIRLSPPSANFVRSWLRALKGRGTESHRQRYLEPRTRNADVARIEAAFQDNPRTSL